MLLCHYLFAPLSSLVVSSSGSNQALPVVTSSLLHASAALNRPVHCRKGYRSCCITVHSAFLSYPAKALVSVISVPCRLFTYYGRLAQTCSFPLIPRISAPSPSLPLLRLVHVHSPQFQLLAGLDPCPHLLPTQSLPPLSASLNCHINRAPSVPHLPFPVMKSVCVALVSVPN